MDIMDVADEYPRPDFDRSHRWFSLNGTWEFAPDADDLGQLEGWQHLANGPWTSHIIVPFPWESPLSEVASQWLPVGWYRRRIERPRAWANERTILHIGAAHYASQVWLNGQEIGEHTGGYLPFSFDITDSLQNGCGGLTIRVESPIDKRYIPHGKQQSRPADDYDSCCFTASSGIWQPVWLEGRPATYIDRVELRPTPDLLAIQVSARVGGAHPAGSKLTISVEDQDTQDFDLEGDLLSITIPLADPVRWTPQNPHLYWVDAKLESVDGNDQVRSYTGLRTSEVDGGRILLNGAPVFLRGALDQGFWPESGHAAPNGSALRKDVELALAAGYNMVRKHIKFEDPRWLYWADKLGLLVWAEPPCTSRYSHDSVGLFEAQLPGWVERDGNHPSIVLWGLYNEEWGFDFRVGADVERQLAVERAYDQLRSLDDSRPIIDNSGWWHVKTDIVDWHYYEQNLKRWSQTMSLLANDAASWVHQPFGLDHPYRTRLSVAGRDHTALPLMNGEYGGGDTPMERGWHLRWQTQEMRRHARMVGYIYTELYDIENELCGIYTYSREAKDLGCAPASINADTVIVFDIVPIHPGCDLVAQGGDILVDVRISHHGPHVLSGSLEWGWASNEPIGHSHVEVAPFELSQAIPIRCMLPAHTHHDRLHVRVREGGRDRDVASGFLDVQREST